MEVAARREGIRDLGARVVRPSSFPTLGTFARLILQSTTLGDALTTAQRVSSSYTSGASYWFTRDGDQVRLSRRFRTSDRSFAQADLMTVGLMTELVRSVAWPGWVPVEIELQSSPDKEILTLDSFAGARVRLGRPATTITFPRALLARRLLPAPAARAEARASWTTSSPPRSFLSSVEVLIEGMLADGRCDVVAAADAAGTSLRTFQRLLAAEGVSFSKLVQRARMKVADRLLADPHVKIIEIAYELGYSDPAHFSRAFRQWTSLTPLECRRFRLRERKRQLTAS